MITETMTVHEALSELKMLDKRIEAKIDETDFVAAASESQQTICGKSIKAFEDQAKAKFASINDMLCRRKAIRNALSLSNARTIITVSGDSYTLAEALELKSKGTLHLSNMYAQNILSSYSSINLNIKTHGLYNSQLLTIAPTGSISTMIGVSGGIEPIFANHYSRKTQSLHGKDTYYKVNTPIVKKYMDAHDIHDEKDLPDYFVTAPEIPWEDRINMQACWQKYIDASISSTINLPHDATPQDIANVYIAAWRSGLKGVTVFRAGCERAPILDASDHKQSGQTANTPSKSISDSSSAAVIPRGYIIDASDNLVGKKRKLITGCGSLHCEAFFDPISGDFLEVFLSKGSSGGCNNSLIGLSRVISLAARAGCSIESIIDQLDSCGICPSYAVRRATKHDTSKGSCCPMAVGRALREMYDEMKHEIEAEEDVSEPLTPPESELPIPDSDDVKTDAPARVVKCPECSEPLVFEGGCNICKNCGWSKCS